MLSVGLRLGLKKNSLTISTTDAFAAFLRAASRVKPGESFNFAVLAGNPSAPGRRHVFLLFNSASEPVAVVKAGTTSEARKLIGHERHLLSTFNLRLEGVPRLRSELNTENWSAFATDFIEGDAPREDSNAALGKIFSSWVNEKSFVSVGDTLAWKRLRSSYGDGGLPDFISSLTTYRVKPVLFHGDFAPWNVKVSNGRWTVLDWERGEDVGIPLWDWMHFVVQPSVLVRRDSTDATVARLRALFAAPEFINYSKHCQVAGAEWRFAFAYVEYCIRVTQQTEGLPLLEKLLEVIRTRLPTAR